MILLCSAVLSAVAPRCIATPEAWPPRSKFRHYLRNHRLMSFPLPYLDVSVRKAPAYAYFIQRTLRDSSSRWFPNSDIRIRAYLQLPAAFQLVTSFVGSPMPRHSLCAFFFEFSDNISRYCPRFLVMIQFELVTFFRLAIFVVSFYQLKRKNLH